MAAVLPVRAAPRQLVNRDRPAQLRDALPSVCPRDRPVLSPGVPGPAGRVLRVRLTVVGSCGAWPEAGQACSGYLVEHDGFRLLLDLGYAVVDRKSVV